MAEKHYTTSKGTIVYQYIPSEQPMDTALVFLPGLTADCSLFQKQAAFFTGTFL